MITLGSVITEAWRADSGELPSGGVDRMGIDGQAWRVSECTVELITGTRNLGHLSDVSRM